MIKIPIDTTETEKEVLKVINSRFIMGREKYGEGISFKQNDSPLDWIEEAIEEAADMLQYLVAMKLRLKEMAGSRNK